MEVAAAYKRTKVVKITYPLSPSVPTVQDYENEEVQLYTYAACSFRGDKTTNQPT